MNLLLGGALRSIAKEQEGFSPRGVRTRTLTMPSKPANPKSFRISLPATSANLGPAFDAAALAMDFYIHIAARPAKEFSIAATGRDHEICGNLENNLILTTYRDILQNSSREITPLALRIKNEIPIGKGCGSSAAARLAGIALAVHFGRLRWTDAQIIGEASRREHHRRQRLRLLDGRPHRRPHGRSARTGQPRGRAQRQDREQTEDRR